MILILKDREREKKKWHKREKESERDREIMKKVKINKYMGKGVYLIAEKILYDIPNCFNSL